MEGITSTKTLMRDKRRKEEKEQPKFKEVPLEAYNNIKHVEKYFSSKFKRMAEISNEMKKLSDEMEDIVGKCRERKKKFFRW